VEIIKDKKPNHNPNLNHPNNPNPYLHNQIYSNMFRKLTPGITLFAEMTIKIIAFSLIIIMIDLIE